LKLLLDTHTFLWIMDGSSKLSDTAKTLYLDPENEIFFSAASYWEICIKKSLGKLALKKGWEKSFEKEMKKNVIKWLNLEPEHFHKLLTLPWHHKDPFDRILISQALSENLTIITSDKTFSKYKVKILN